MIFPGFHRLLRRCWHLLIAAVLTLGMSGALVGLQPAPALAAATPEADQYQVDGPIRQTHNPLSKENFHGGVQPQPGASRIPTNQPIEDTQDDTLVDKVKNFFSNDDSEAPSSSATDLGTTSNPTLERYSGPQ